MQQRINLVPQKPLAERIKTLIPIIFSALLLLIVVLFFSWVQLLNLRLTELNQQISRIEEQASQSTALSGQIAVWKTELAARNMAIDHKTGQIATLSKIRGQKKKFSQPLSLIASLLPDTVRCQEISFTGAAGRVQGVALDYDDLVWMVRSMQALQIFQAVSLTVTDRTSDKDQKQIYFTITLQLVPASHRS